MEAEMEGQRGAAAVERRRRARRWRARPWWWMRGVIARRRGRRVARAVAWRAARVTLTSGPKVAAASREARTSRCRFRRRSTALDVASSASTPPNSRRLRARGDPRPSERHLHHTSHPPKKINFPTSARPRVPTSIFALCRGPWASGARARTAILSPASPPPEPRSQSLPPSFVLNIAPSSAKPASPVSLSQNQITKHNA